jgi:beta-ureidopropionase / N-carbamoyl-L-amino-acid hydrolase
MSDDGDGLRFDSLWDDIVDVGRPHRGGGYERFAWTPVDQILREWFSAAAAQRGLTVEVDRVGNQWAWWGDPDAAVDRGGAIVAGSHLDSVPGGGAFDGPLGVVSALAAIDALRAEGFAPARPIGVVNFVDEEGARFGVACAGSRLLTGQLSVKDAGERLVDDDGVSWIEAAGRAGVDTAHLGRDDAALRRVGAFIELHVEQGRGLIELNAPIALASAIWPHGRWRMNFAGEANHAGTTRLDDRHDAMLPFARAVLAARESAARQQSVATVGRVSVVPNGVNAIASLVIASLDVRGPDPDDVRSVVAELTALVEAEGGSVLEQSWTGATPFDANLRGQLSDALGAPPVLATGAGHDAGILDRAGIPTAMIFVRNPSGVSHSPAEFAERADCLAGVAALTTALRTLSS